MREKRRQWRNVKSAASFALTLGFFYLLLAYLAKFSSQQSIALALVLAVLWIEVTHPAPKAVLFAPYHVAVAPHWADLLTDFKLIRNREDWDAIQTWVSKLPPTEYSVLRSGISFTVVQEGDSQQTLIYRNNHRSFATRIDFEEIVKPLEILSVGDSSLFRSDVWLFMQPDLDGYGLGIDVPSSWWSNVKDGCPKPLRVDEADTGRLKLLLAPIPYREFRDTYCEDPEAPKLRFWIKSELKRYWDERDRHLATFGWSREADRSAELGRWAPELCLKHKYFSVVSYLI